MESYEPKVDQLCWPTFTNIYKKIPSTNITFLHMKQSFLEWFLQETTQAQYSSSSTYKRLEDNNVQPTYFHHY